MSKNILTVIFALCFSALALVGCGDGGGGTGDASTDAPTDTAPTE